MWHFISVERHKYLLWKTNIMIRGQRVNLTPLWLATKISPNANYTCSSFSEIRNNIWLCFTKARQSFRPIRWKLTMESLLKNLKEHVTCSICLDTFTEPKTITCLHTFCCECLKRHALKTQRQGQFRCPECQAQVGVPESFDQLPTGFLQNLSLIHIWRCRRIERCRSRWSPYH